jgi:hypothetical protein
MNRRQEKKFSNFIGGPYGSRTRLFRLKIGRFANGPNVLGSRCAENRGQTHQRLMRRVRNDPGHFLPLLSSLKMAAPACFFLSAALV